MSISWLLGCSWLPSLLGVSSTTPCAAHSSSVLREHSPYSSRIAMFCVFDKHLDSCIMPFLKYFLFLFLYTVASARTCHCTQSQRDCSPDGKCRSTLREDDFSCLVARRYYRYLGDFVIHQLCIHDYIDYGLYCNEPAVGGLVFDVSIIPIRQRRLFLLWDDVLQTRFRM